MEDTFHGLLPALVRADPTSSAPGLALQQPMNDRNEEETDRYVPLASCQYFVLSMPTTTVTATPLQSYIMQRTIAADGREDSAMRLHCERLIDPSSSSSMLARAFEIPFFSEIHNKFVDYCLFKNEEGHV